MAKKIALSVDDRTKSITVRSQFSDEETFQWLVVAVGKFAKDKGIRPAEVGELAEQTTSTWYLKEKK